MALSLALVVLVVLLATWRSPGPSTFSPTPR